MLTVKDGYYFSFSSNSVWFIDFENIRIGNNRKKLDEAFVYKNAWKYPDDVGGAKEDSDYLYFSGSDGL